MTRRLLVSYAAFALVVLVALEVPLAVLGARRYRSLAVDQTEKVATALAVAAGNDFEAHRYGALQGLVIRFRDQTGGDVAVVNSAGTVVAGVDTDHDNDTTGPNHAYVVAALAGVVSGAFTSAEDDELVAGAPIGDGAGAGAVLVTGDGSATERRIHLFWGALAGFAVVILAAAVALGWRLARTVTRPLLHLGFAVQALGGSDLNVRADERRGPPEVAALARQFNQMADQLRELIDAQNRFVADASHQLRSPLAALRLRIENLLAGADPTTARTFGALDVELRRLSRLVDGLINLGHAETATPIAVDVDLGRVVRDRTEVWSALAAERGVALEVEGPAERLVAPIGEGDLDQIVDNLLANALDVSPAGSRIRIAVSAAAGGATIRIADEGPGMTEEELARAFDRFWRGSTGATSAGGLGLAIVRQLAVRNALVVDLSRLPGGGIEASVRAPRAELG